MEDYQNCDFKFLDVQAFEVGTDKLLEDHTIQGCFTRKKAKNSFGLVEISDPNKKIKVSYFDEGDPNILKFLDIKIGERETSKWRDNLSGNIVLLPDS